MIIHATIGGVKAAPSREPAWVTPCAQPRSEGSIHRDRLRVAIGNAPASPTPKRNRQIPMLTAPTITAVSDVNALHHSTISVNARRGPKRSPSQPPGIWKKE